ncbi:hypothetical protein [Hydrogenophaga soli]
MRLTRPLAHGLLLSLALCAGAAHADKAAAIDEMEGTWSLWTTAAG